MTEQLIKEHLSNGFIGILAANKGFMIDKPSVDYGVDYQLKKTTTYTPPSGGTRYIQDSRYIDLQLKATTENSVIYEPNLIKYDLEVKSYNDLVERQINGIAPLVLILFVLPSNPQIWVEVDEDEIKLRRHAYWYVPPKGSVLTNNIHRVRIEIPKVNMLGIDCFSDLHQQFYP
ncbi:DUF4365 domain-containing protein [Flavobacterium litorale]|uniref:DUF4365 domain-containing protein n=1 Tax=Flavobacterium litorale TaxID=2856519 RepID=A0ABX8V8C9_9FLAO|nr:DUF4365 domain-containing protein [Flavobacterium litorale]QYJ69108.1 DUF4365 domain-containing protein [Flavobacterium litorale]